MSSSGLFGGLVIPEPDGGSLLVHQVNSSLQFTIEQKRAKSTIVHLFVAKQLILARIERQEELKVVHCPRGKLKSAP